ncbi:MAG TPA: hypothetical protein VMM93_10540 [Vicinamibacterales bacterium]|nr:hypothetical protein [Vicinamibacterales bacterium]
MTPRLLALVLPVSVLVVTSVAPARAQEPVRVGSRVGTTDPASAAGYDTGGRRDPFVSLVMPRRPTPSGVTAHAGPRPSGLAGLSVADIQIRGIVRHGDRTTAIAEGPDGLSYVLRVKDRLFNAEVKSIEARVVVLVERVDTPTGVEAREVRKPLRPAGEGGGR